MNLSLFIFTAVYANEDQIEATKSCDLEITLRATPFKSLHSGVLNTGNNHEQAKLIKPIQQRNFIETIIYSDSN